MKVYVLTINQAFDGVVENSVAVFHDREKAIKALNSWRIDEMEYIVRDEWKIGEVTNTSFEAYEDGHYATNHSYACVTECDVQ